jgi:hypothetical protein
MPKPSKSAEVGKVKRDEGTNKQGLNEHGVIVNPTRISEGHKITNPISGKTDCGEYIIGWHFGLEKDITCNFCLIGLESDKSLVARTTSEDGRFDTYGDDDDA